MVGGGSVGKRHGGNFRSLGCEVDCFDPRADRRSEFANEVGGGAVEDFDQALASGRYIAAVIGSPTSFHVGHVRAAQRHGLPVLVEKPLSIRLQDASELLREKTIAPVLVGYTWRWWRALQSARDHILAGRIGRPLYVHFDLSAHLADWHPWERYQDFFMAKKALGGGALLDESHWIDLAIWIFGMPSTVQSSVDRISDLEIETDDNVDATLFYPEGLRVVLHLDLYGRPHRRRMLASGTKGTLTWSDSPNEVVVASDAAGEGERFAYPGERNDMFMALATHFMEVVARKAQPSCTLNDGYNVMAVIEAIRASEAAGRRVRISDMVAE